MSQTSKRKSEDHSDGEKEEHESTRQKMEENTPAQSDGPDLSANSNAVDDDDLYVPQHKQIYGDSIFAACEAANATRTRRHKSDEEKRLERLAANRRSARESRNRKKVVFEELQRSVARLAEENAALRRENAAFRKEMTDLKRKYGVAEESDLTGNDNESAAKSTADSAGPDVTDVLDADDLPTMTSINMPALQKSPEVPMADPTFNALLQPTTEAPDLNLSSGASSFVGAADLAGGHGIPGHSSSGRGQNRQTFQSAPGMGPPRSEASSNASSKQDYHKINYDQLAMLAVAQQQQQYANQAANFPGLSSNFGGQDMSGQNDTTAAQLQQQQQEAQQQQNQQQKQQQNTQTTQMLLELLKMQHAALLKQQQQPQGSGGSQI